LIRQENAGAAAARNRCMEAARGEFFAYLDSDNLWHPDFLRIMVEALTAAAGQPMAYANYFDVTVMPDGVVLNAITAREFDYELQLKSPFIDLNSLVHHRALFETFGGFDEGLPALQDYDLIARYAWPRDALHVPVALNIYQRMSGIGQISEDKHRSVRVRALIGEKVARYYSEGIAARPPAWAKKATVLSWDMSRNHFAKAYSVAEALSRIMPVQLISFRFFDEPVFAPVAGRTPPFEVISFEGAALPNFLGTFCDALEAISGDFIYAVKPRLTSFGLALLANRQRNVPVFLECNDLETMLEGKRLGKLHRTVGADAVLARSGEASVPHALIWSQYLDGLAAEMPMLFSHNENLNRHYGSKCLFMRNVKDESIFDPSKMNRQQLRRAMGVMDGERVILFGGVVNDHKGVAELLRFVDLHETYRLFVAGSVETPELERLKRAGSDKIRIFPPQRPEEMAKLNHAADAIILWLDPREDVSHYQMPYKFTDAIAMGTPVVSSPVSDLAKLQNVVWHVPYLDFDALHATLQRIFSNDAERARRCEAGRRLFQKEFTYRAVRQNISLACHMTEPQVRYPAAARFADMFEKYCRKTGADTQRLRELIRVP
jgi:glycosyltransferase involved in cell wall biosynthesis